MNNLSPLVQQIRMFNRNYQCLGRGPGGRIKFKSIDSKHQIYLSPAELNQKFAEGTATRLLKPAPVEPDPVDFVTVSFDLASTSEDNRKAVERRHPYIEAVMKARETTVAGTTNSELAAIIRQVARKESDQTPPCVRTLQRWLESYDIGDNSLESLVPDRRGNSMMRLHFDTRNLLDDAIRTKYLTSSRNSMKAVHDAVCTLVKKANAKREPNDHLQEPSYNAVRAAIRRLDRFDVLTARYGIRYARAEFHAYGKTPEPKSALEVVQVDHTLMDLYVTFKGMLVARPWLTLVTDVCTRAVLAYLISFEPPSYATVMEALGRAIMDKDGLLKRLGEPGWTYPMRGVPAVLLLDNGKEFRGRDLKDAAKHFEMTLEFTPRRSPWFKAQVERMFGLLQTKLVEALPGRVLKPGDPGEKPKEFSVIEFEDLDRIVLQWVATVYHNAPHVAINDTPLSAWNKLEIANPVTIPYSESEVMVYLGKSETRTLKPRGIELFCARYNSDELQNMRRHLPRRSKVRVKYSPWDLGKVHVLDPNSQQYIPVPAVDQQTMAGRTLHRHLVLLASARALRLKMSSNEAYQAAEEALTERIASLSEKDARRVSRKLSRFLMDSQTTLDHADKADEADDEADEQAAPEASTVAAPVPTKRGRKPKNPPAAALPAPAPPKPIPPEQDAAEPPDMDPPPPETDFSKLAEAWT